MVSKQRDIYWKTEWFWSSSWFIIYSGFVISTAWILRPNENSEMLTQIQELLDETLNEMPTQEEQELDQEEIEMHQFGMNIYEGEVVHSDL